mmetsp:Transcript_20957/g.34559  ORF Transcript_20957/g.34559 Transcript_20957/m.34559 type:complete len:91 (-) Transcript_20957:148-420(-)
MIISVDNLGVVLCRFSPTLPAITLPSSLAVKPLPSTDDLLLPPSSLLPAEALSPSPAVIALSSPSPLPVITLPPSLAFSLSEERLLSSTT